MLTKTPIGKCANLIKYIEQAAQHFGLLNIVETGTVRKISNVYQRFDGYSTIHIANWIKKSGKAHKFYSVDLQTTVCQNYLHQNKLLDYVNLIKLDSITFLQSIDFPVHIVYLDSANDADHILNEYLSIKDKVIKNGYILVDDVNLASRELFKGDKLVPYLKVHQVKFSLLNRNQMVIYG